MPDKEEITEEEDAATAEAGEEAAGVTEAVNEEIADDSDAEVEEESAAPEAAASAEPEVATEAVGDVEAVAVEEAPAKKDAAKEKKPAKKKAAAKKGKKKKSERADVKVPAVKAVAGKDLELNPAVFAVETKVGVIHEVVRAEMAARRQGNASTKTRGEVRGGGAKPWRQKGTGRARAGSSRIPHWTGGGIAFGPTPRDYTFKVNRKMRNKALKMALSVRAREGRLRVVEGLEFEEPKTAAAAAVLDGLDVNYPLLLVLVGEEDANVALSFRNLPWVGVTDTEELEVSDIIGARTVLTTSRVIEQLNAIGERK